MLNLAESARAKDAMDDDQEDVAAEEETKFEPSPRPSSNIALSAYTPLPLELEKKNLLMEIMKSQQLTVRRLPLPQRPPSPSGLDRKDSLWKGKPMTCGSCLLQLRSKRYLLEHMRDHARAANQSQDASPFSCASCNLVFPYFTVFEKHRREEHEHVTNSCRCENCDLYFTFKEFKSHEHECLTARHAQQVSDVMTHNDVTIGVLQSRITPPPPHTIAAVGRWKA